MSDKIKKLVAVYQSTINMTLKELALKELGDEVPFSRAILADTMAKLKQCHPRFSDRIAYSIDKLMEDALKRRELVKSVTDWSLNLNVPHPKTSVPPAKRIVFTNEHTWDLFLKQGGGGKYWTHGRPDTKVEDDEP